MGKDLKILLVGLGSIGRKHLSFLKNINSLELAALRTSKGKINEETGIQEFFSIEEALKFKPDGVLIANPTSLHVDMALPFLKEGIKVLIEKPIDDSYKKALQLEPYKENLRVAYCMRFLPTYEVLKEIFKRDKPFKVGFKRSYYLPKWHPYADYREEYTAKKNLGGGVIRTLSHEIDLSIDWFGVPKSINGVLDKVSHLEIDTDDYAFFTTKTSDNIRVNFELDFFSPININQGEAYTSKGKYYWDMNVIHFVAFDETIPSIVFESPKDAIDKMYKNQVEDFIHFIKTNESANAKFEDGLATLDIIEKISNG